MSLLRTFQLPGALAIALMLTAVAQCQSEDDSPLAAELKSILAQQAQSWNQGDIDGFMKHYPHRHRDRVPRSIPLAVGKRRYPLRVFDH